MATSPTTQLGPPRGSVHVTILRIHQPSNCENKSDGRKFFAKINIDGESQTSQDRTIRSGWDQELTFDVRNPSRVTIEVYKRRKVHRDALIGSVDEGIGALLSESFTGNIVRMLQSTYTAVEAYKAYRLEFKLNIEVNQDAANMAAMIQRARIRASRLQVSQVMQDSAILATAQSASDVSLNTIKDTWDPLLEKLQIFTNIAESVAEVHPYAKAAYSVITVAYKMVVEQMQRDINILCLIETMDDIYAFIKEAEPLRKIESHQKVMASIARQTTECGYFISAYCGDSFLARAIKYSMAPTDTAIVEYGAKFAELKAALLAHAAINTEIAVLRVADTVKNIQSKIDLNDLLYADGARFHIQKQCMPGSREEILADIHEWINTQTPSQPLFVLSGGAGTGKSAIAHTVAHHYHCSGRLGSSIFSADLESTVRSRLPSIVLPTIARDLADLDSHYCHKLWCAVEHNKSLRRTPDPVAQFESFLLKPFTTLSLLGPIVIVIDGLEDSHGQSPDRLLSVITERVKDLPSNFRILLTARPDSRIMCHLSGNSCVRCRHMEDVGDASTRLDLLVYARARFAAIVKGGLPAILCDVDLQELVESSDSSFPRMISACDTILGASSAPKASSVFERYQAFVKHPKPVPTPPTLPEDRHFLAALSRLFDTRDPRCMSQFECVMSELLTLFVPLSISSLARLRSLDPTMVDDLLHVTRKMGSLFVNVIYQCIPITPIHAMFYDFLRDRDRSKEFHVDVSGHHQTLARNCIRVLQNELRFNICRLPSSYVKNADVYDISSRIERYISPELSYASRFWIEHLLMVPATESMISAALVFIKTRLFFWLETLSVIECVDVAIKGFPNLIDWCQSTTVVDMDLKPIKLLAESALSFVKAFEPAITLSAPHIYISAVRFWTTKQPEQFLPRFTFPHDIFKKHQVSGRYLTFSADGRAVLSYSDRGVVHKRAVPQCTSEWTTDLSDSHWYSELDDSSIWSSDGETVLVFWSQCCWKLSAETGKVIFCDDFSDMLYGKIHSIAFGMGSERFAITSRIHNGVSLSICYTRSRARILGPLKVSLGHYEDMRAQRFSPSGAFLACASNRGRVLLWDTTIKEESVIMIKLKEGLNYFRVAFSPDERRLIAWCGGQIYICDTRIGHILHNVDVERILSPGGSESLDMYLGGQYLVYRTVNDTLSQFRFIDAETGEADPIGPLSIKTKSTYVAFSPDGTRIASCDEDNTVQVQSMVTPFGEHSMWGKGDDSGWVLGKKRELLAWVPPEMREGFEWTPEVRGEAHGTSWTKCLVEEEDE